MNCFPCFGHRNKRANRGNESPPTQEDLMNKKSVPDGKNNAENNQVENENENGAAKTFTFRELAAATKNFRQDCLVGEGGFGRVYKGLLPGSGQVVAVKQLDRNGLQGNKEFLNEILTLSLLQHQNLVNLIGYCADGDQRLLVYEFMSGGSLENHIHDNVTKKKPLDWFARMRIAYGAAQGLEYLHDQANPIIYRDLKPSNVLLDEELNPKLSDYGLAKLGPSGDSKFQVSSMVTYGYSAPEYTRNGEVTAKSDVYSFGVVLLELITGRKVIDTTRPTEEQNLVSWAQPIFRDPKRFPDMADPLLSKQFPEKDLNQVVAIAAMCLQEEPTVRPLISDVVTTLSFITRTPIESLGSVQGESIPISVPLPPVSSPEKCINESKSSIKYKNEDKESSDSESSDYEDSSNVKLPKRNSSNHLDICNSNDNTREYGSAHIENSSDYEDSGSVDEDEGSGDEYEEGAKGSKRWQSKSSRKSSRNSHCGQISSKHRDSIRSRDESDYSSRESSLRTSGRNLSSSYQSRSASSTKKLDGDAMSLDHVDNTRLDYGSSSLSKSSKDSSNGSERFLDESVSFGQKSGRGLHEARRMSITKSSKGSFDEERKLNNINSMGKSADGSISPTMSSNGSFDGSETFLDDETFSIDHNSKRLPQDERILLDQNSSRKSHGGSVLLDHTESLGSQDGSSSSSHSYSNKSGDASDRSDSES